LRTDPFGDPGSNRPGRKPVLRVMEDWAEIRRLHRAEAIGSRSSDRLLGVSKETVKAAIASSGPASYE
jgi:hypothetical protein